MRKRLDSRCNKFTSKKKERVRDTLEPSSQLW